MIISSSWLGAYLIGRSIYFILGYKIYPMVNEFEIPFQLKSGALGSVPWHFYVGFATNFALAFIGYWI